MIVSDEEAKAAQEIAKTTGKALDVVSGAGAALVGSTVAAVPGDLIGLVGGDWLHEKRRRIRARLEAKTAGILDLIARERLTEPTPAILLPLLEAARDEDREGLQVLWAGLLANSMIEHGRYVRREYFNVLREMDPQDAVMLEIISKMQPPDTSGRDDFPDAIIVNDAATQRGLSTDEQVISANKLRRMGCIYTHNGNPSLTAFGRSMLFACQPSVA